MKKFSLVEKRFYEIKELFNGFEHLMKNDFDIKIKNVIKISNNQHLWGACRQARIFLDTHESTQDLFVLIENIHRKRRKNHKDKLLILHCFENALRSFVAIKIADLYNKNDKDEWFLEYELTNISSQIRQSLKMQKKKTSDFSDTFELFDHIMLKQLNEILAINFHLFEETFLKDFSFNNKVVPAYNKNHLMTKLDQIRQARNEIYHNHPTKIRFLADLENIALRLGYNLNENLNLQEIDTPIKLKYNYGEQNGSKNSDD